MVAIELHALSNADMINLATSLLSLLLDPQESVGVRALELLSSFDMEWHDSRDDVGQELSLLSNLNTDMAKRPD
ncbi:hypothetical protein ABXW19_12025, partial [Streptococcus suis]|uniref:hypothetical protein n=1 Tax=Streptococcus suis TaxID=1307 RepID=UPI003CFACE13